MGTRQRSPEATKADKPAPLWQEQAPAQRGRGGMERIIDLAEEPARLSVRNSLLVIERGRDPS